MDRLNYLLSSFLSQNGRHNILFICNLSFLTIRTKRIRDSIYLYAFNSVRPSSILDGFSVSRNVGSLS